MQSKDKSKILICKCSYSNIIPDQIKEQVEKIIRGNSYESVITVDLCGLAARKDAVLQDIAKSEALIIFACYPRAVKSLFSAAELSLPENTKFFNMRTQVIEEVELFLNDSINNIRKGPANTCDKKEDWVPWFPVIDYERCRKCKQCASFCLFGVYETTADGKIVVSNPQNCKTNCPACARICPDAAIIFTKLDESPINGDEIGDEDKLREKIKINIDEMLGDDVYAALAERRRKAKKRLLRKKSVQQAIKERDECTQEDNDVN